MCAARYRDAQRRYRDAHSVTANTADDHNAPSLRLAPSAFALVASHAHPYTGRHAMTT